MPGALSKRLIAARHLIEDHVVSKESRPFQRPEIRCLHAVIDRREKVFVIFLLHLIKFDSHASGSAACAVNDETLSPVS